MADLEQKKKVEKALLEGRLVTNAPLFLEYMLPNGFLDTKRESHALFYYYLCARKSWEEERMNLSAYEGDLDSQTDYRQLLTSVATLYGVQPEGMVKCWEAVDKQCFLLAIPKLPDEERYRFDRPILIDTKGDRLN